MPSTVMSSLKVPPIQTSEPSAPQERELPHYYSDIPPSIARKFYSLDDSDVYKKCEQALKETGTKNFVVDFGGAKEDGGKAFVAVDLEDALAFSALLKKPRAHEIRTRWIHLFSPHTQTELVGAIAAHYGFSPRLGRVIATPPSDLPTAPIQQASPIRRKFFRREGSSVSSRSTARDLENGILANGRVLDVQDGVEMAQMKSDQEDGRFKVETKKMSYMDLVTNVWHWHAVEWGGRFTCIGFNHLHKTPSSVDDVLNPRVSHHEHGSTERLESLNDYNPQGLRLWTWITLCDDGTLLSFQEPPPPNTSPEELLLTRRNILTIFRSLSVSSCALTESQKLNTSLEDLPFRKPNQRSDNVEGGPSLLFYYLYDDWQSSYAFVLGRGAPYSTLLLHLRRELRENPKVEYLDQLHILARQLAALKRMYETKKIIIDNVLYRQENSRYHPSPGTPRDLRGPSMIKEGSYPSMGDPNVLGVPLSPLAVAKFERLRDRIMLYAIGELESLLTEYNELVSMTFNMISLKESQQVERLTRVTIWLTGFTFFFLPLTLVTGYFSMQLNDMAGKYTEHTFWGSAGVTFAVTLIFLYTVGKGTGTMEFKSLLRAVRRAWWRWGEWGELRRIRKAEARAVFDKAQ